MGDPNILWVVVLMGMMPPTEDTNPVRRKNRDQQIAQKGIPIGANKAEERRIAHP